MNTDITDIKAKQEEEEEGVVRIMEVKGEYPIFFKPFAGQPCNR
jgi:hypothetical protein